MVAGASARRSARAVTSRLREAEVLDHGLEVAVTVQELVTIGDAEGTDQEVDRLANGDAAGAQLAIVEGRTNRQLSIDHRRERQSIQCTNERVGFPFVPHTLEQLAKDEVAHENPLPPKELVKSGGL